MQTYFQELNAQLLAGLAKLPEERRQLHGRYLAQAQNPDGGFSGREGDSDLYYTGFALRGLSALDLLTPEIASKAADFLRSCLNQKASVIDLYSLLYACLIVQVAGGPDVLADSPSDWPTRVAEVLESCRTKDGGYNKSPGSPTGSTYHTFLVGLCFELLGQKFPDPAAILAFVQSRRREDGGFVEVTAMRRSGTNPTAAGVGILQLIQGRELPESDIATVREYLIQMPSMDGGLRANDRVPLADLLSTFTGSWTLHQLGALDRIHAKQVRQFVDAIELPTGGFHGGIWDDGTDVEYTFYGLGTLALFAK